MTSNSSVVPSERTNPQGILSADCEINPVFCDCNVFFLHYCSSDLWSGNKYYSPGDSEPDIFRFKGQNMLQAIFKQIAERYFTIEKASRIFIAGASAGSEGAQFQGDRLAELIRSLIGRINIDLRILGDSRWFHPGPGLIPDQCEVFVCNHEKTTKEAAEYMNISFDESCAEYYGEEESWKCGFPISKMVIEQLDTPTFFATYLYDQVQMGDDGISKQRAEDFTEAEKAWALKRKSDTAERISKVAGSKHGFFAINCLHHVMSDLNSQISSLEINGYTFSQAVELWLSGQQTKLVDDECGTHLACNAKCPSVQFEID